MSEKKLYKPVREWLEKKGYYCGGDMWLRKDKTERFYENIGDRKMRVDVAGVRNIGSLYADDLEVVCKNEEKVTFIQVAQAYGYTLVANRVYLASTAVLDREWDHFFRRSGLGFLHIAGTTSKITEIVPSSSFSPNQANYVRFLRAMWIVQCSICGVYNFRWDAIDELSGHGYHKLIRGEQIERHAEPNDHPFRRKVPNDVQVKRYICRYCLEELFFEKGKSQLLKKEKSWDIPKNDDDLQGI